MFKITLKLAIKILIAKTNGYMSMANAISKTMARNFVTQIC